MSGPKLETDYEVYKKNYKDASGYHSRALQFAEEKQRPSLVFNVASVAIERYLIALCAYYGIMPHNHNYICLMDAAETVYEFDPGLNTAIRSLDDIFGICSLDNYYHGAPEPEDARRTLDICEKLKILFTTIDSGGCCPRKEVPHGCKTCQYR